MMDLSKYNCEYEIALRHPNFLPEFFLYSGLELWTFSPLTV
jgi:hypothetical protein